MASEDLNSFCQFGGHDSKTSRTGHQFYYEWKAPLKDDSLHIWLMCEQCALILLKHPDPTMAILCSWATECDDAAKQLPELLREDPMKQAKLVHYVDVFLDNIRKKQFGGRFPAFIRDINENEKEYFLQELEKDITIRENFLYGVENGAKRRTIALKLWVGCVSAAKGTRKTHNIAGGGQEEYTPEQREADFKEADNYGEKDEIFRSGVEVATILELVIRLQPQISLERALSNSPIRRYVKPNIDDKSVKKGDLVVCNK